MTIRAPVAPAVGAAIRRREHRASWFIVAAIYGVVQLARSSNGRVSAVPRAPFLALGALIVLFA